MPDPDLERLRESIRQNLEALDQILHRQAEQEPERPPLRLIKGGAVAAALVAGVEWLRRHREVTVALVVAAVAAAAAWLMWPSNDLQPSVEPPARTSTVTVRVAPPPSTSVSPLPTPRTAAPTTVPTTEPTTVPTGATEPTAPPRATVTRTMQQTVPPTQPTTQPATLPTSPRRTTAPPTEPTRTTTPPRTTPSCLIRIRINAVVGVCVRL